MGSTKSKRNYFLMLLIAELLSGCMNASVEVDPAKPKEPMLVIGGDVYLDYLEI